MSTCTRCRKQPANPVASDAIVNIVKTYYTMDELKTKAENLTDHVSDYLDTYYKLTVLNATEKTAGIASVSITAIFIGFLVLFVLLFSGFGFSWWIGKAIDSMIGGFFIMAGIYMLFIGVIFIFRKKYIAPFIRDFIIQKIYE
jgi:hypothetical protein